MSGIDTSRTTIDADFAGRRRRFRLRFGEIEELERLCGAGIGAIMVRVASHQFTVRDVWETIRLGLEGGGEPQADATALVLRYREEPLADYLGLAGEILSAAVAGAPPPGKGAAAGNTGPGTSPPSTKPEARPA